MRRSLPITIGLWIGMLAILALAPLSAPALDWPQWLGPDRDGISKETGLAKSWPKEGPKLVWQAPLEQGYSSMIVVGNRLYTQYQKDEKQYVAEFDTANGKELWKFQTGDAVHTGPDWPGPRSTPILENGKLYVLDGLGNLFCFDAASKQKVWNLNILEKFGAKNLTWCASMSPLLDGEHLIVNPGESDGNSIVALDKKTGATVWTAFDPKTKKGLPDIAGYSSPVVATLGGVRQYVFFTGSGALGVNVKDGALLWRFPWKTSYEVNAATPLIQGDTVLITSGYNHGAALLRIKPGTPQTVEKVWENKKLRSQVDTPILYKDHIYGYDDKSLACLDLATGTPKWSDPAFKQGTLAMADGMLYVLGQEGSLALVKPSPEKCERIAEFKTPLTKTCWIRPIVANGKLFVRDEALMLCYDISGK
jgi:outer membrane protein assembly factor BamB